MDNLMKLALRLRVIFEENHKDLDIPFFYSFPKNCCEGASIYFGHIAKIMYPDMDIKIIKGFRVFNEDDEGCHFWAEVDGKVYDLTSDQFVESTEPVINKKVDGKHIGFRVEERQSVSDFLLYYIDNRLELKRFLSVREKLLSTLKVSA
jgi:hypothetical protein